jgi:hypothetical protein
MQPMTTEGAGILGFVDNSFPKHVFHEACEPRFRQPSQAGSLMANQTLNTTRRADKTNRNQFQRHGWCALNSAFHNSLFHSAQHFFKLLLTQADCKITARPL